jgi:hypothetical protein
MKAKKYLRYASVFFFSLFYLGAFGISFTIMQPSSELQDKKQDKPSILYIVDGEVMTAGEVDKLDMADIEKLEHIKEKEKIERYTDEDVDIVILITMKEPEEEDQPEEDQD